MHDLTLLYNIAIVLVVAFIGGLLARCVGLPAIVGYLLAGIVIGPSTSGFLSDTNTVDAISGQDSQPGLHPC